MPVLLAGPPDEAPIARWLAKSAYGSLKAAGNQPRRGKTSGRHRGRRDFPSERRREVMKKVFIALAVAGFAVYFVWTRPTVAGNGLGNVVSVGVNGVEQTAVFVEKVINRSK
jgi:ferric-dicitrate binding protein FerR (iron transport regulator)